MRNNPHMNLNRDLQNTAGLLQQGQHKKALKSAKGGMRQYARNAMFPNLAGIALCALGRHREAIALFSRSISLDPAFPDAQKNLGLALIELRRFREALAPLRALTEARPDNAEAWVLLALSHMELGSDRAGVEAASRAIALEPGMARALSLRGTLFRRMNRLRAALEDFRAALAITPGDTDIRTNIARCLSGLAQPGAALDILAALHREQPGNADVAMHYAVQLEATGRTDEAVALCHGVLAAIPDDAAALAMLSEIGGGDDRLADRISAALAAGPARGLDRAMLYFAMARCLKGSTEAERYVARGNAEMRPVATSDPARDERREAQIYARFPAPMPPAPPTDGPRPIYVVGLPRSGTTLAEAMIGAHPGVTPLGERGLPRDLVQPLFDPEVPFGPDEVAALARADRAELPDLDPGTIAYVDKLPDNYHLLGLLRAARPDCRIVHLMRDPRDIALSMWRGHFDKRGMGYTFDLGAMAHRFNLYARLMRHWRRLFSGDILDIAYSDIVADPEAASRQLARFCDLDWVPAMSRPHEHAGQILTMSVNQVRQPVHDRSVGRWRAHREVLQPFIDGLDPGLWPGIGD